MLCELHLNERKKPQISISKRASQKKRKDEFSLLPQQTAIYMPQFPLDGLLYETSCGDHRKWEKMRYGFF